MAMEYLNGSGELRIKSNSPSCPEATTVSVGLYICMCLFMYVHTRLCCIYMCAHSYMYVNTRVCPHMHIYIMFMYRLVCLCVYACLWVYPCAAYAHMCIWSCVYMCGWVCMCVHKLMYVYVHVCISSCLYMAYKRWEPLVKSAPGFFSGLGDWDEHWRGFE